MNKKYNNIRRFLLKLVAFAIFFTALPLSSQNAAADPGVPLSEKFGAREGPAEGETISEFIRASYYFELLEEFRIRGHQYYQGEPIFSDFSTQMRYEGDTPSNLHMYYGRGNVLLWEGDTYWIEWDFEVTEAALYNIEIIYAPIEGSSTRIVRSLTVNGEILTEESRHLEFLRSFIDAHEPRVNSLGDQVRPRQKELIGWTAQRLIDSQGMYSMPFLFYFEPGVHTIRLQYITQPIVIESVALVAPIVIPSYAEVYAYHRRAGVRDGTDKVRFQAHSTVVAKSDSTIRLESDPYPVTYPISRGARVFNSIGGYSWRQGNQSITWSLDVPEAGLYQIAVRHGQWFTGGNPIYRQIRINGEIPFAEMIEYEFPRSLNWQKEVLHDKATGEPFLFYLQAGENTITMTAVMGPMGELYQRLHMYSVLLSQMIFRITMIAGSNPDPHFDYAFTERIPDLVCTFREVSEGLYTQANLMMEITGERSTWVSNKFNINATLRGFIDRPDTIARRMRDLTTAMDLIMVQMMALEEKPLLIDYIEIGPPGTEFVLVRAGIFARMWTSIVNFLRSFTVDHTHLGSVLDEDVPITEVIDVWVARGREWGELMKELADENFTPYTGIAVNMNIIPGMQVATDGMMSQSANALLLAISSGGAPDVAIGVGASSPVEFAIRQVVTPLSDFPDFEEVAERFVSDMFIPFTHLGSIYGLPDTMTFRALFYRTDIIEMLNIRIPDTWDDFYYFTLPALTQNRLQFNFPQDLTTFLFQNEGRFYNDAGTRSALDDPEAFQAFRQWTQLYTHYNIPVWANFYMRMRTGEMPMGIGDYNLYMTLMIAAPELTGRWSIAPIPGTLREDGTVDRSTGGVTQDANIILRDANTEASWEFLKWWSSTETQVRFGQDIESLIGSQARWPTANREAFAQLPWPPHHTAVIREQSYWYTEIPNVLGGYFTGRHVRNAWNRVVIGDMNPRDSLDRAVRDINRELRARQEEYGIFVEY